MRPASFGLLFIAPLLGLASVLVADVGGASESSRADTPFLVETPRPWQARPRQGAPAPATAAKAEVLVLLAKNDHSGIDPTIGKIPELLKPPLSSFDSYKLLQRTEMSLDKKVEKKLTLPDKSELSVTLNDLLVSTSKDAAGKSKTEKKFSLGMSIPNFLPSLEVSAKENEWFFIAGQKYQGGTLVIGFRLH